MNVGDASGGALKFVASMSVVLTALGTITFVATTASTTYDLTTGGKTMPNINVAAGSTTTIRCADSLTATGATLTLTSGGWNWNGFAVTAGSWITTGTLTRTWTPGASAIIITNTATSMSFAATTNLTITANTATVTMTGASATFSGNSFNFNGMSLVQSGSGNATVTNGGTLAAYTRTGTAVKTDTLTVNSSGFSVTGAATFNSNSSVNRLQVLSSTVGTPRIITAGSLVCTNVIDFQDITGAGAATWTTAASGATYFGDCGGNSGITMTASAPQTHTASAGGNWSDATKWTSRVPLPQDDVVVDVNTTGTLTADMPRAGKSLTFTGFVGTCNFATSLSIFGSLTLASGMTFSVTGGSQTFAGRGSFTITMAGKTFNNNSQTLSAPGGTYTLQDAFTTVGAWTVSDGTFVTNDFAVTALQFISSSGRTRAVTLGTSTVTLTNAGATSSWSFASSALTFSGASSTIVISTTSTNSRTFGGAGLTYGTLTYTVAGSTGALVSTGANTFGTINFSDASNARTLTLPASVTTTVTTFNVNGTALKLMTVNSSTPGTRATLSKASGFVQATYLNLVDSNATGGATFLAGYSTDGGNNLGWNILAGANLGQGVTDSIVLSDSVSGLRVYTRSVSDSAVLSDLSTGALVFARTVSDSIVLSETASALLAVTRGATDSAVLSDSVGRSLALTRGAVESLVLSDAAGGTTTAARSVVDSCVLSDGAGATVAVARTANDSVVLSDGGAAQLHLIGTVGDSCILGDSVAGTSTFARTAADSVVLSDAATRGLALVRVATDSVRLADVATGFGGNTVVVGDSIRLTDVASGIVRVDIHEPLYGVLSTNGRTSGRLSGTGATYGLLTQHGRTRGEVVGQVP